MKYRKGVFFVLISLLILRQPLAAHEQNVQAQLKELRDLLALQQEELAAIEKLDSLVV